MRLLLLRAAAVCHIMWKVGKYLKRCKRYCCAKQDALGQGDQKLWEQRLKLARASVEDPIAFAYKLQYLYSGDNCPHRIIPT